VPEAKYDASNPAWHSHKFELAALKATHGFFENDTLVLTVDISVRREARLDLLDLDPGGKQRCCSLFADIWCQPVALSVPQAAPATWR
jgi:hypothetical protein